MGEGNVDNFVGDKVSVHVKMGSFGEENGIICLGKGMLGERSMKAEKTGRKGPGPSYIPRCPVVTWQY